MNRKESVSKHSLQHKGYVERVKPAYHNAERYLIAHMLRSIDVTFKVQEMLEGNTLNIDEHQAIITYLYGFYENDHIT